MCDLGIRDVKTNFPKQNCHIMYTPLVWKSYKLHYWGSDIAAAGPGEGRQHHE